MRKCLGLERWRKELYVLWVCNFVVNLGFSLVMPFLPFYVQELGVTEARQVELWTGAIFAANFVTMTFFSPIWGAVADRTGRKLQMLRSGFGMALVVGLMGLARNVWQLLGLRLLQGVFSGFIPASTAYMAANVPQERAGWALGVLQTAGAAGTVIGPLVGGLLARAIGGYRPIFFLTAGACFLAGLVVLLVIRERFTPPPHAGQTSFVAELRQDLRQTAANPVLLAMMVVYFFNFFGLQTVEPILTLFLQTLDTPAEWVDVMAGAIFSASGIANVIFAPLLGRVGDRVGYKRVLIYALGGASALYLLQGLVNSAWQLLVLRFLLGVCLGGGFPAANALVARAAGREFQGRAFGLVNSAIFIGDVVGPLVGGLVASAWGHQMVFPVTAAALMFNLLWVQRKVPEDPGRGAAGDPDRLTPLPGR